MALPLMRSEKNAGGSVMPLSQDATAAKNPSQGAQLADGDAMSFLQRAAAGDFSDPPAGSDPIARLLRQLADNHLARQEQWCLLETERLSHFMALSGLLSDLDQGPVRGDAQAPRSDKATELRAAVEESRWDGKTGLAEASNRYHRLADRQKAAVTAESAQLERQLGDLLQSISALSYGLARRGTRGKRHGQGDRTGPELAAIALIHSQGRALGQQLAEFAKRHSDALGELDAAMDTALCDVAKVQDEQLDRFAHCAEGVAAERVVEGQGGETPRMDQVMEQVIDQARTAISGVCADLKARLPAR